MTVQDLIDVLVKIQDKTKPVRKSFQLENAHDAWTETVEISDVSETATSVEVW